MTCGQRKPLKNMINEEKYALKCWNITVLKSHYIISNIPYCQKIAEISFFDEDLNTNALMPEYLDL